MNKTFLTGRSQASTEKRTEQCRFTRCSRPGPAQILTFCGVWLDWLKGGRRAREDGAAVQQRRGLEELCIQCSRWASRHRRGAKRVHLPTAFGFHCRNATFCGERVTKSCESATGSAQQIPGQCPACSFHREVTMLIMAFSLLQINVQKVTSPLCSYCPDLFPAHLEMIPAHYRELFRVCFHLSTQPLRETTTASIANDSESKYE